MSTPEIPREELQAAVQARVELGREHEAHLVEAFLDRIERDIDARVDARIEARLRARGRLGAEPRHHSTGPSAGTVLLALGSMGCGIGATGAATGMGDGAGLVVAIAAWMAIAVINVANVLRR